MSRARLRDLQLALQSDGWTVENATTTRDQFQFSGTFLSWEIVHPVREQSFELCFGVHRHPGYHSTLEDIYDCTIFGPVQDKLVELVFCNRESVEWKSALAAFIEALGEGGALERVASARIDD